MDSVLRNQSTLIERVLNMSISRCLAVVCLMALSRSGLPQLVAQGPTVAAATSPEKWETDIQAFEKKIIGGTSKPGSVLFIGSSSIRKWDLPKWFPDHQSINHGFGGSEISDSLYFFDRAVTSVKPSLILLYAGDNDIGKGKTAEIVHQDFRKFVKLVREKLPPQTTVAFIAIKPSIKRWNLREEIVKANSLIAKDCEADATLEYVDVWTPMLGDDGTPTPDLFVKDGLHLSDKGYQIWTDAVMKLMPQAASVK